MPNGISEKLIEQIKKKKELGETNCRQNTQEIPQPLSNQRLNIHNFNLSQVISKCSHF